MIVVYYDVEKGKHITIDNVYSVLDDKNDGFVTVCFEDETREYSKDIPKEYLTSINALPSKSNEVLVTPLNTQFSYMYRDGANYKDFYEFVFEGTLSDAQKQAFVEACSDEYFIPRALGLPGGVLEDEYGYDEGLDHYWCEHDFEDSFDVVNAEPTLFTVNGKQTVIKAEEFLELFTRCSEGWEAALPRPIDVMSLRAERGEPSYRALDSVIAESQEKQSAVLNSAKHKDIQQNDRKEDIDDR